MATRRRLIAVAVAVIGLIGCTQQSAGDGAASTSTSDSPATSSAAAIVDQLRVRGAADPPPPTYRRDAFGDDWAYDPATGCNTRERVLAEESLTPPTADDRCRPTGTWRSAYDGLETSDPADLQIDHLVALADAWRSGAWMWDDDRRFTFANDLTDPTTLIAVSGATNQSKGDSSPDRWMPPDRDAWCSYAADWVSVKSRWDLTVTAAEKSTLVSILNGCP